MGGALYCRSEGAGQGASFTFELPFTPLGEQPLAQGGERNADRLEEPA